MAIGLRSSAYQLRPDDLARKELGALSSSVFPVPCREAVYAKTEEEVVPDMDAIFSGNRIMVKTLDLNQPFDNIKKQLSNIIELFDF